MSSSRPLEGSREHLAPEVHAANTSPDRVQLNPFLSAGFACAVTAVQLMTNGSHPLPGYPTAHSIPGGAVRYSDDMVVLPTADALDAAGYPPLFQRVVHSLLAYRPEDRPTLREALLALDYGFPSMGEGTEASLQQRLVAQWGGLMRDWR